MKPYLKTSVKIPILTNLIDTTMETAKKVWTVEEVKTLLENNDGFVCRSVVKIYEKQTEDEQATDSTGHNNGIGYNGTDAFIMSRFAKFFIERKFLSPKQLAIARKKIMKYAKQLTRIANELPAIPQPEQPVNHKPIQVSKLDKAIQTHFEFTPKPAKKITLSWEKLGI